MPGFDSNSKFQLDGVVYEHADRKPDFASHMGTVGLPAIVDTQVRDFRDPDRIQRPGVPLPENLRVEIPSRPCRRIEAATVFRSTPVPFLASAAWTRGAP